MWRAVSITCRRRKRERLTPDPRVGLRIPSRCCGRHGTRDLARRPRGPRPRPCGQRLTSRCAATAVHGCLVGPHDYPPARIAAAPAPRSALHREPISRCAYPAAGVRPPSRPSREDRSNSARQLFLDPLHRLADAAGALSRRAAPKNSDPWPLQGRRKAGNCIVN